MRSSSRVIKNAKGGRAQGVEPYQGEALDEALLEAAGGSLEETAERVIEAARREAVEIRKQAHQEGYSEGEKAGRLEFENEIIRLRTLFEELTRCIQEEEQKWIADLSPKLVRLAVAIASKILEREVAADENAVLNAVARALRNIVERGNLVIHVNPGDLDRVRKYKLELSRIMGGVKEVEVIADDAVDSGGALVETDHVKSDARIATQLEQIAVELEDEWLRT